VRIKETVTTRVLKPSFGTSSCLHRVGRQRPGRRQLPAEREPVSLRIQRPVHGRLLVLKAILWIETDDNTFTDVTNAMLLAAVPGVHGDGGKITVVNKADGSPNRTVTADKPVETFMGKR
jgi:hypothetical protein